MRKIFLALMALILFCFTLSVNAYILEYREGDYDYHNGGNAPSWYIRYYSEDKDVEVGYYSHYRNNYRYNYPNYYYSDCYGYNCPSYYRHGSYPSPHYIIQYYPMLYQYYSYPFGWVRTIGRANYCIGWDCSYYS